MQHNITIAANKSIYFASDFHLGAPNFEQSLLREKKIVRWLNDIKPTCQALYLVGDIFDFWFDYGKVAPIGFTRLLGKLAEFTDHNIPVYLFTGNHDLWNFNYLEQELNVNVLREKLEININNKKLLIAHGDGLGPNDKAYKRLKKIFSNKLCQFLFKWLHPNVGVSLAHWWSRNDLSQYNGTTMQFFGEKEWLIQYAHYKLTQQSIDYFIFGHRHIPLIHSLNEKSKVVMLGDWINHFTYAKMTAEQIELLNYE